MTVSVKKLVPDLAQTLKNSLRNHFITRSPYVNARVVRLTKDEYIIILSILMAIVLTIELGYILLRRKRRRREAEMRLRKTPKQAEPLSDKAHNTILTAQSISSTLAGQGVNTREADSLLDEAKRYETMGDHGSAIERAEAAKLALLRAKREHETMGERSSPAPKPKFDLMAMEAQGTEVDETVEEDKVDLSKLPNNYIQAKFMLSTTRDQLDRKGIRKGEAHELYKKAESYFEGEDYSRALSFAIKAERLLDSNTVDLIGEDATDEEEVEVMECPGCGAEVGPQDTFCRKCGEKLEFLTLCPGCEAEVEPGDAFCRKCGQKLADDQ
jgi:ribosomal protein L40E